MAPNKTRKKAAGLSSHHHVSYGTSKKLGKTVPLNRTGAQLQKDNERLTRQITALSFLQREQLFGQGDYDVPMPDAPDTYPADGWQDIDSDKEAAFHTLPPGEEGLYHSHAGKEAAFHKIFDKCRPGRGDAQRRATRVQTAVNAWWEQMPRLIEAYLALKRNGPVDSTDEQDTWHIEVIGLEGITTHPFVHSDNDSRMNETLVRHGYIGASPEKVSLAFPIALFEVPRRHGLAEQLSTAYDAYLEIMRRVDVSVQRAMGHDTGWYMQNVCAPCLYKTRNEMPLKFSWLGCMDGNNSLKLIDSTFRTGTVRLDGRSAASSRWLSPEQVDIFKDEVAEGQKKAQKEHSEKKKGSAASTSQAAQAAQPTTASTSQPRSASAPSPHEAPDDPPDEETPEPSCQDDDPDPHDDLQPNGDVAWLNVNELSGAEADNSRSASTLA
ncbi:hypothetical protein B0H10DRAFT_2215803 [Mycena sp. CBHHK59/15]|nr:hypothetical protein B0H10DRAFT_2215803 [Mycena sp. CBHHK59/15]